MPATDLTIEPNKHVVSTTSCAATAGTCSTRATGEGGEPIGYVHGYGMLVPGLEAALAGLKTGDEREIVVPAEAGYGEHDEELVLEVERTRVPRPQRPSRWATSSWPSRPTATRSPMRVVELKGDAVVVDANHPLAGLALHYKVKVLVVRSATEEELEHGRAELAEAEEHEHGPDCSHSHGSRPPRGGGRRAPSSRSGGRSRG